MKKLWALSFIGLLLFLWYAPAVAATSGDQLIIINKANNELAFYENNKLAKTFSVATGKTSKLTPEGKFKVVNKVKNRPFYKQNIPGGDPRNPLGARWIGFNAKGTNGNTYAIHGNNNPSSIGTYASNGCVRMHNEEVIWLYDKVKMNTAVVIVSTKDSFDTVAKKHGYKVTEPSSKEQTKSATLKVGSKGEAVKKLQKDLTSLGYSTKGTDGTFGPNTKAAVQKFQRDNKLKADGVAGSKTLSLIESKTAKKPASESATKYGTLKAGSNGQQVKDLQQKLTSLGYNTKGVDGKFGPATKSAVRKFQKDNKLKADGIAGPATQKKLYSK
ncbi:L,D-transpeptidase family protein [Evansella clarkii]|uniref:L,D-transpeptidase family protein n=1 Tax=Evansella clarkii TaxID=79879 RepID=UPI000B44A69A|nr:peptidoglycan-binding protein [Evansella clarkii]